MSIMFNPLRFLLIVTVSEDEPLFFFLVGRVEIILLIIIENIERNKSSCLFVPKSTARADRPIL